MSSPRVGVVRKSMLTNPRIIKPPLGQTRFTGLSGLGFTFGTSSSSTTDGGVAEVLSSWRVPSPCGVSVRAVTPDFVSLNREAVKSGLVTSKQLSQYRAQRGDARGRNPAPTPEKAVAPQTPAVPDITFGAKSCRPSSPLSDLLSHQYARRWLDEQLSRKQTVNHTQLRIKPGCIPDTRTSLLRRSRVLPVTQTPLELPHFTQVPPALDTFRHQEARLQAFRAPQSHSASRRGVQGEEISGVDAPEEETH